MELQQLRSFGHVLRPKRRVYLDNNATTRPGRAVRKTMKQVLRKSHGNPSSIHATGREAAALMEESRRQVAGAINADPGEVYFTGCATESNNAVLKSLSDYFFPGKNKIIASPVEHPSVMAALRYLEKRGVEVCFCPVDSQGRLLLAELEQLIDGKTFLVCCMLANNEIGTIQDLATIANIAHRRGVLVLSDCVQAQAYSCGLPAREPFICGYPLPAVQGISAGKQPLVGHHQMERTVQRFVPEIRGCEYHSPGHE